MQYVLFILFDNFLGKYPTFAVTAIISRDAPNNVPLIALDVANKVPKTTINNANFPNNS